MHRLWEWNVGRVTGVAEVHPGQRAAAAVPRNVQEMAVWLHARGVLAAISGRRDLGSS